MKKQVSFYIESDFIKQFQDLYPHCLTLLLRRCVIACLRDKNLFSRIFFDTKEVL